MLLRGHNHASRGVSDEAEIGVFAVDGVLRRHVPRRSCPHTSDLPAAHVLVLKYVLLRGQVLLGQLPVGHAA